MSDRFDTSLHRFLGTRHVYSLVAALGEAQQVEVKREFSSGKIFVALVLCSLPALAKMAAPAYQLDFTTLITGAAACLAFLLRSHWGFSLRSVPDWRLAFRQTHTAVALGCIPVVVLLMLFPESFFVMKTQGHAALQQVEAQAPSLWRVLGFVVTVATWAALTEELIYRGLLLMIIRRWNTNLSQARLDLIAIVLSSAVFAMCHFAEWGPIMTIGIFGLGCGFGVAFIATGELLLPVLVYHFLFDALSLAAACFF